jgi:hypothetical protein
MNVIRAGAQPDLEQEAHRKFTLFDAIVSMSAIGLTLALARTHLTYLWANLRAIPYAGTTGWQSLWAYLRTRTDVTGSIVMLSFTSFEGLLVSGTLAFLIMRLRQPRPPFRRLVRQPGMVVCEVWLLGMFLGFCISSFVTHPSVGLVVVLTACAIPIAWGTLALLGRLEAEPSWIDRMSRVLGVCWAGVITLQALFMHFSA